MCSGKKGSKQQTGSKENRAAGNAPSNQVYKFTVERHHCSILQKHWNHSAIICTVFE